MFIIKPFFLLQHLSLILPIFDNLIGLSGITMVEAMLEPHIRGIGGTKSMVGISFVIYGVTYLFASPIAGYVSQWNLSLLYIQTFQCT